MFDCFRPGRCRIGSRGAAAAGSVLLIALALTFLLWSPARANSEFDVTPPAVPASDVRPPSGLTSASAGTGNHRGAGLSVLANEPDLANQCPTTSAAQWDSMAPAQRFIYGAAKSPDLNMDVRGWYAVDESLGFVRYPYPPDELPDTAHPLHLSAITGGGADSFASTYQMNEWDWQPCNCGVPRSQAPYPVTMLGLRTTSGQPLHIPSRDLPVNGKGYAAMVMYADAGQLAIKYTAEDRVDNGYLVHLVDLCVDPNLVALYQKLDAGGRQNLPVVFNDSVVGTALGTEVGVVVRDRGDFMDPRSWQDWWQDQPPPAAG